ncbi:MAG: phosphoribosylanthranilate isomerase [Paracoccaceae bacterium]
MTKTVLTKICGLTQAKDIDAAVHAGARYIGLNFFEKSPRFLPLEQAQNLVGNIPAVVVKVALTVNAGDATLDRIVAQVNPDMLQLHGNESPARVEQVRARFGLPVMKAVGVQDQNDLIALQQYCQVADLILVDAKPPKGAKLPGGNGVAFDWRLISGRSWPVPWLLAGGLTAQNVTEAIRLTGASQVDASSGVESAPGVKEIQKIQRFIEAAEFS